MNENRNPHTALLLLFILIFHSSVVCAQQRSDTLNLKSAMSRALATYPTIQQAQEAVKTAQLQSKLTESAYLPTLSGVASYLYMNPISKLTMGEQTIHIQSNHNATFGLSLNQLIWDFGKTRSSMEAARMQEEIALLQQKQVMQDLRLQTISSFYITAYARQSIDIKERQLIDYEKLLMQTELKRNSGSATNFDYLNTNAEYNAVKTAIIALKTAKEKQYVTLSLLADTIINDETLLPLYFPRIQETRTLNELIDYALINRIEMQLVAKNHAIAIRELQVTDRSYNPVLSAGASAGFKNGYEPSLGELRFNYSVGATLHIPIYESGRRKKEKAIGKVEIERALTAIESARKEITSQVADSYLSLVSAWARIDQLTIQQNVSQQAFEQAKVNYMAGAITNLELLTSGTNAINSSLLLLQEQINYQISYYQLLINIGEIIY